MNSLERSLQLGLAVSLLLLMVLFWWAGSLASRLLAESLVVARLQAEAVILSDDIRATTDRLTVPAPDDAVGHADFRRPGSGRFFMVRARGGVRVTSASAADLRLRIPMLVPGQQRTLRGVGSHQEPLLLWLGGYSSHGQYFTLAVGEDVSPIESRLRVFQWFFAGSSLVLMVALLSVQRLIIRGSVRRLERIREDITRLEHGQAEALSEAVPREIQPLVQEFNRLLLRFDKRLQQSRNALGNLAHTLKGPLSVLLRACDTDESGALPHRLEIALNAERIHQLIDSELKRARLAGRGSAGQLFDLDAELPSLTGLLRQVYSDKSVDIRILVAPDVALYHDRQDMLELIGNLMDNACEVGERGGNGAGSGGSGV